MTFRTLVFLIVTSCALVETAFVTAPARAQQTDGQATIAEEKSDLKEIAKRPEVQEELEEPDGVSVIEEPGTDNWKIIAIGTGTYEFNDAEERKDATEEAILEAKAALVKFAVEGLATESQLDKVADKASKKSKVNGEAEKTASSERMKTVLSRIHNTGEGILSGILTLETTANWDGDSGEVRVTLGQSAKSLAAAEKFKTRTLESVNRAASGPPTAGKATNQKPGSESPSTLKRKSKTAF